MVEITLISTESTKEIASLEAALFSDPWSEKALADFFSAKHARGLICRIQGEFAGYLTGSLICGEGELLRIGVDPRFRRKGLGARLIRQFRLMAENEGAEVLFLEVRKSNTGAAALYEACGFVKTGERKGYYQSPKEDALLYQLKL
ncbi:MAG: ribosomal protein S18-alanine N-acetyltransferase [Clostridia bacterium]|nr:ribosomal protein S18-alanine N-acetyltransferase [Clostridia bacterium]